METIQVRCDVHHKQDADSLLTATYWRLYEASRHHHCVSVKSHWLDDILSKELPGRVSLNTSSFSKVAQFYHDNDQFARWVNHQGRTHAERFRKLRSLLLWDELTWLSVSILEESDVNFLIDLLRLLRDLADTKRGIDLIVRTSSKATNASLQQLFQLCTHIDLADLDCVELERYLPLMSVLQVTLSIEQQDLFKVTNLLQPLPKLDWLRIVVKPRAWDDTMTSEQQPLPLRPEKPVLDLRVPCITAATRLHLRLALHQRVRIKLPADAIIEKLCAKRWCYTSARIRCFHSLNPALGKEKLPKAHRKIQQLAWLKTLEVYESLPMIGDELTPQAIQHQGTIIHVYWESLNRRMCKAVPNRTLALTSYVLGQFKYDKLVLRPIQLRDYSAILMWMESQTRRNPSELNVLHLVIALDASGFGHRVSEDVYRALLLQVFVLT
eukprot:TRINITY_DN5375_c0_g1_i1.p1 TRINITY_DN5375_c0_g1~~TRINITY_DN5375_c0_g1_i1.p1  ORF type:complete len:439 (+),score=52.31 TRINITY_DN5375_c0_g1_i1:18-1334(+)